MSKPDDIPQDVKHAALAALKVAYHPAKSTTDQIIDAVYSAILGERERCARKADPIPLPADEEVSDYEKQAYDLRLNLAAAIRKGGA